MKTNIVARLYWLPGGLFSINDKARVVKLSWEEAGLEGKKGIRDVWRQMDVGTFGGCFSLRFVRMASHCSASNN
ncbi:hypothetical protein [Pontiella sulfatireligans]|uniref:Uncharacterized protein n=1 Tax=Pontiella sulfatireligans TaxID=2750658 RepID=A0A6C2UN47_9BACT|nr:hypothetical protein [Pontiella sulfatireligans]VGO20476.1 hypothetical protein SCARR_02539 [Pontiella sulfatireligans]